MSQGGGDKRADKPSYCLEVGREHEETHLSFSFLAGPLQPEFLHLTPSTWNSRFLVVPDHRVEGGTGSGFDHFPH